MNSSISQRTNDSGVDVNAPEGVIQVVNTGSSMGLLAEASEYSSINIPSCVSEQESEGPRLPTWTTNNTRQTIEKAKLIDISANKEWIAYVSAKPNVSRGGDDIELAVHRLMDFKENALWPSNPIIKEDISKSLDQDFEYSISFLSVSPKGDLVSISYVRANKEQIYTTPQPKCLIFRVDEKKGIFLEDSIEFQGRAVFISNDKLALVNEKALKIYDCRDGYKLMKWFDLDPIFEDLYYPGSVNALEPAFLALKTSMISISEHRQATAANNILQLTKLLQHNMIVATYKFEGSRIWALDRDGIRVTSFNSPRPVHGNILNMSSDKKLVASFVKSTLSINVYHVKTGSLAYQLKSLLGNKIKNSLNYDRKLVEQDESSNIALINCIQFCSRSQYLFHISVYELKAVEGSEGSNNSLVIFEVWNIEAEISIYVKTEKIRADWQAKNSMIEPFVVETRPLSEFPVFTAVFTSLLETGGCEFRSKNLAIFEEEAKNNWKIKSIGSPPTDVLLKNLIVEFNQNLYDQCCVTYLAANNEQDCNFEYMLRFGICTVQLWRICKNRDKTEEILDGDQLLYIRAFKSPFYHFNEAFHEKWMRNDQCKEKSVTPGINNTDQSSGIPEANQNVPRLGEHGIHFIGSNRLVVSICHPRRHLLDGESKKKIDYEWLEEIYLPIYNTSLTNDGAEVKPTHESDHFIQSVCQALHLMHTIYDDSREKLVSFDREILKSNFYAIQKKTAGLVLQAIGRLQKENSGYFKTISGSKTLAMLASFQEGREMVFKILETDDLQICLFSYFRVNAKTKLQGVLMDRNENALTVLIEERDYRLYDLMLNRILLNSHYMGLGNFSAVSDALVFLQDRDETDILKSTCAKLQFLQVDQFHFSYLNGEIVETMNSNTLQKVSGYAFAEFLTGTTNEQIICYNNSWMGKLQYKSTLFSKDLRNAVKAYKKKHNFKQKDQKSELITICVVPLVYFCSYATSPEDSESHNTNTGLNESSPKSSLWCQNYKKQLDDLYKEKSDFMRFALKQRKHDLFHQNTSVLEVLLYYKWRTAIQCRFLLVCAIHIVYYVSFFTAVLFAETCFGYDSAVSILENRAHLATIILMLIFGGILGFQEFHQLYKCRTFKFYDLFDYIALILPAINLCQMLTNMPGLYDVGAITTIALWIHGILRLRPIEFIGITLETIIKLIETVYKTLFIMLLLVIAFTHAFIVLLSHKDDSYFQEQFSGSVNLTQSNLAADNVASYYDDSTSNSFKDPVKAFSSLWFFIFGVWDPINDGEAGDNYMIIFLAVLFSFLTVFMFFNLIIALMSGKAEEVRALGRGIWLSHFAAVIAEIELLWCVKSERTLSRNNPAYVFYVAKIIDVQKQIEMIEEESESLVKKIQEKCSKKKILV